MGTTKTLTRRRSASRPSPAPKQLSRRQSFSRDIGHAAAETYLVTRLSFKLLRYLGYYFFIIKLCIDSHIIYSVRVFFFFPMIAPAFSSRLKCNSYIIYDKMIGGFLWTFFSQFSYFKEMSLSLKIFCQLSLWFFWFRSFWPLGLAMSILLLLFCVGFN